MNINMQPIRTYPPDVQKLRERLFDLLDAATRKLIKTADEELRGLPPELQSHKRRELQAAYLRETQPIVTELMGLEMFARVSVVMRKVPEGEVVAR